MILVPWKDANMVGCESGAAGGSPENKGIEIDAWNTQVIVWVPGASCTWREGICHPP